MKKVLSICLALVMVLALSFTVCAAPGSFIESPSNNGSPVLEDFENESEDCEAELEVTGYGDREDLYEEGKEELEYAYDNISRTSDLTNICNDLNSVVEAQNILSTDLGVSDLFHMHYLNCDEHNQHGRFRVKLSADTLKGFVSLIQLINGEWVVVSDAAVEGTEYLTFSTDVPSTFAIVVDTTKSETDSPKTGDISGFVMMGIVAVAVLAITATGVVVYTKKRV